MVIKTDWTPDDGWYNAVDWNRIGANLNELATDLGLATVAYASQNTSSLPIQSMRAQMANHAATIAAALNVVLGVDPSVPAWFDYIDLNAIENLANIYEGVATYYGQGFYYGEGTVYGGGTFG